MSLFKNEGQEGKMDTVWVLVLVGGGYKERMEEWIW
jgi:hypothetical protein